MTDEVLSFSRRLSGTPKHYYGRDFEQFEPWKNHIETRHADGNRKWWLVVEDPDDLPFDAQEP